jgi:HlyD family secretion protein
MKGFEMKGSRMKGFEMKEIEMKEIEMKGSKTMGFQKLKRRFNLKKILKALSIASSFTVVLAATSCMGGLPFANNDNGQTSAQSQGMQTYTVVRGNILQEASTTGSVDVKTTNTYVLEVTGKVISALEQGDSFKKGDTLVELDNSDGVAIINDLEDSLQTAEDSLAASKSSLTTAKINYQKALDANHIAIQLADLNAQKSQESVEGALVSLESANINADLAYDSAAAALEKATSDATVNASSTDAIDSAQNKLDSTQASGDASATQAELSYEKSQLEQASTYWNNLSSLQAAEVQIKLAKLNISDSELKYKQAERSIENAKEDIEDAKTDLENYKITAAYDGIISSTGYKADEQAGQGGTGISVLSNEYILKATISENDLPKVKVGNEAVISLDAYSDVELNGTLEKINPVSTTTNGIVSYEVLISFKDVKDVELFYGLSANISIITAKADNVLYVPLQAVYKENGKSYVDILRTSQTSQANQTNQQTQGSQQDLPTRTTQDSQANQSTRTAANTEAQTIEKVEVTTGINDYVNIEIKSGINEGDIIVTSKVTQ